MTHMDDGTESRPRFERPADDRDDAELAAAEGPGGEEAFCPLTRGTVQLLPLRYGLVAPFPAPPPEVPVPYTLTSMPMGLRLLRNGYLYVLDGQTHELHEYEFKDHALASGDAIGGHNGGRLEYPTDRTIHVGFSEIRWTEAKRAQIQQSDEDRDAFMQAVNLAGAGPVRGGEHLIPPSRAEQWVAEFAGRRLGGDAELYAWENEPYFHETRIGKLFEQHEVDEPDDCLCLLVRDDLGVMRDLAQYQDMVVEEIQAWAEENGGRTERDYLLGCYIESITELAQENLDALAELDRETAREALWDDLEERDDGATRQAVTDFLNQAGPLPEVDERRWPAATHEALRDIDDEIARRQQRVYGTLGGWRLEHEVANLAEARQRRAALLHRERVRAFLTGSDADPEFVDDHLDDLLQLHQEQRGRVDDRLNGARLGQRGINGLVRREEMDAFLEEQRERLAHWNATLDLISADRAEMLCAGHFHRAAWYFDPQDEAQVKAALLTEYSVVRDIGRSDATNERLFGWLQANPHFDRPLFYGLSLADRSALIRDYAVFYQAGYDLLGAVANWADRLAGLEAGKLPDVAELDEGARAAADAIRTNLSPAVGVGLDRVMSTLFEAWQGSGPAPTVEDLFRSSEMPKVLGPRLIDAARRGDLSFRIDTDVNAFRATLGEVLNKRDALRSLNNRIRQARSTHGHRSERVRGLQLERRRLQVDLSHAEQVLAQALSPVEETPGGPRAGVTLILPEAQRREVSRLVQSFRLGLSRTANVMGITGDGLSLAIFVVQAGNLAQVLRAHQDLPSHASAETRSRSWVSLFSAISSTGAAGFSAAQGIGDRVLTQQARALGVALEKSAIGARLGRLHVWLGGAGYLMGFAAAGIGLYSSAGNLREAVRSGQSRAQLGAALSVGGNLGMMGAYGYGTWASVHTGVNVLLQGAERRAANWAAAGKRLSGLFWRLNLAGAIFTVLELGGTWLFNRYNLDAHDRWLLGSPWGHEAGDAPYEHYAEALERLMRSTHALVEARYGETVLPGWLDRVSRPLRNPVAYTFTLHLPEVAPALLQALGEPPMRVSFKAWRLTPAGPTHPRELHGTWAAARWHEISDEWAGGLSAAAGREHAGLVVVGETPPEEYGEVRYVLGVRYQWPDGLGGHHASEQYILIRPRRGRGAGPKHRYVPSDEVAPASAYGEWHELDPALL